ncbi:MAG: type II toxin-antitoxin system Phd/YefM family antitoxin [Spirochaeta sp.]
MLLDSKQMIAVTQLQKELTKRVRDISNSGEPLYILKNNNMEAVMLSFKEYERLHAIEELFEQLEIQNMLQHRLETYRPDENVPWEQVKEDV